MIKGCLHFNIRVITTVLNTCMGTPGPQSSTYWCTLTTTGYTCPANTSNTIQGKRTHGHSRSISAMHALQHCSSKQRWRWQGSSHADKTCWANAWASKTQDRGHTTRKEQGTKQVAKQVPASTTMRTYTTTPRTSGCNFSSVTAAAKQQKQLAAEQPSNCIVKPSTLTSDCCLRVPH